MKPTETVAVRKIDLTSHRDEIASEQAAVETPVTIYVNAEPVATLVAIRGPIYSGLLTAKKTGITLCCYAKGPRMNVCSGLERVLDR
jgi:formate dehydrogenase assembly factor FdhD